MARSLITDAQPPEQIDEVLAEFLVRMFQDAKRSDEISDQFPRLTVLPSKPIIGKLYYFDQAIPASGIDFEGFYIYKTDGDWHYLVDTSISGSWDDEKFPASGDRLNSAATRYSFDFTNIGIQFQNNARYGTEDLVYQSQMRHAWRQGDNVKPHVHWEQNQNARPNWGIEWRKYKNGQAVGAWTQAAPTSDVFTYVSGSILQISVFAEIDMSDMLISDFLEIKLYRDTTQATTPYLAIPDPYTGNALYKEFDIHVPFNNLGSESEFSK